jgi:hypothetical protein
MNEAYIKFEQIVELKDGIYLEKQSSDRLTNIHKRYKL